MSKLALTYITMNAGDGIPGSILKWALQTYAPKVDYTVVVDGDLTDQAKEFYKTIPNLRLVDSKWTGRHVDQYYARNNFVDMNDWVLCFDDDEFPSSALLGIGKFFVTHDTPVNIFYSPSVTFMSVDNTDNFWRVQEYPTQEDFLRRSKRLLYKRLPSNYFISSPCGMHVTPTQVKNGRLDEQAHGDPRGVFYHMKTIESFIYNECIYNVSNPRHESGPQARQMTEEQEIEFERLVNKYNLKDTKHFLKITKEHSWPEDFKNFVFQFKDKLGLAMCKFYYLYNYISYGIKDTDVPQLMDCISLGFNPVYLPVRKQETPVIIPRTKNIW